MKYIAEFKADKNSLAKAGVPYEVAREHVSRRLFRDMPFDDLKMLVDIKGESETVFGTEILIYTAKTRNLAVMLSADDVLDSVSKALKDDVAQLQIAGIRTGFGGCKTLTLNGVILRHAIHDADEIINKVKERTGIRCFATIGPGFSIDVDMFFANGKCFYLLEL